jgi:hypothetical protein
MFEMSLAESSAKPLARALRAALPLALAVALGCAPPPPEETVIFQDAETCYRAGDYDGAVARYQTFLQTYPRSPLATTAELRLRTINREIESIMGTRAGNRPEYQHPSALPGQLGNQGPGFEPPPEPAQEAP